MERTKINKRGMVSFLTLFGFLIMGGGAVGAAVGLSALILAIGFGANTGVQEGKEKCIC